ncbi:sensor histidine kinase [Neolewinella aurantiaca]|uniref:Sensor histidine kinase n=1 Tax=Neolewinella aurantiaca TaxID=2602767 RepID=A0A5C7FGC2_9BACT|nr:histidine kinase [Neolewinella aurantiaca]TXF90294.1 sensor histidine kinase [Neolewinella aurantiaca]
MENFFQRHKKTLLHVAFWAMYASYFFYNISYGRKGEPDWERIMPDFLFHVISLFAISYVNYFFFLPRLLKTGKIGQYFITYVPIFLGMTYLALLGKQYLLDRFTHDDTWMYSLRFGLNVFVAAFFVTAFVGLMKFVEDYFELEAHNRELENRQLTSELRFLKAQVNPHFLFNTLNNLYYLAVNQSDQTPEVIAKLSGMMRYMIHESNAEKVPLSKEVEYMENYLDLERLRLNEEVPITFEVNGDIAGARVTPLILITFLENAFKHGIGNNGGNSWITVSLTVNDGTIVYKVANSVLQHNEKTVREASGLGLANVRRRLDLSYPGNHQLDVTEDDERYSVNLKITL